MTAALTQETEKLSQRLLSSSARAFYEPELDIDWEADFEDDKFFTPPERVSLYGTYLWDRMSHQQRVALSRHETASVASVGLWFEMILMQMLTRYTYDRPPQAKRVQYSLTEMGEECRHIVMFARMAETLSDQEFKRPWYLQELGRLFKNIASGPTMFAGILVGEEILDRIQREMMANDELQPLPRMVARIHVLEEARHVSFARAELARSAARLGPVGRRYHQLLTAVGGMMVPLHFIHPDCYRAVGLDPKEARKVARSNPYHQQTIRWGSEKLMAELKSNNMLGLGKGLYRIANML